MKQGILMVIFGHASYGKWAYNMAMSLRHFSPEIKIHLVAEESTTAGLDMSVFDTVQHTIFETTPGGGYDVADIKTRLIDYSPFDQTIYLDADGVCLKDITPLFGAIFHSHFVFSQTIASGGKTDAINYAWAAPETMWSHFKLKDNAVFPAIQSSLVAFDKSKKAQQFFKQLQKNYTKPIAKEAFAFTWGRQGAQPDELYYGGTMAQLDILPDTAIQPVHFPHTHTNKTKEIVDNHYILAMYGSGGLVRPFALEYYDRLLHMICRAQGRNHLYKAHALYKHKFSGNKPIR